MPTPTSKTTSKKDDSSMKHHVVTFLEWKAPGRPFRKRGRNFFASGLLLMFLIEVILFLFAQYALMLVVLTFTFLAFALAIVPPHDFKYRISSEGAQIEDSFFLWQELYDFYFMKRFGAEVLHIRTRALLPGELTLTLNDEITEDHIKTVLIPFLPFREYIRPTFMEKSANWLTKTFPLEKAS